MHSAEPVVELRGNDVVLLAVVVRTALRTTRFLTPGSGVHYGCRCHGRGAFECSGMSIPASDLPIGSSVLAVCRGLVQRFRADL